MTFEEYISVLSERPSAVKHKILARLWAGGENFPRGWVRSSELLALTKQKYFDRRIRELRDELGCDIETGIEGGEHAYRLLSTNMTISNPRAYLTEPQKRALFEHHKYRCSICGAISPPGIRGLQADHKIPLKRGGCHEPNNWQPLCVECNVGKRRVCAGCDLDCRSCPWAFPEKKGLRLILQVPPGIDEIVHHYATKNRLTIDEVVTKALEEFFSRRNK